MRHILSPTSKLAGKLNNNFRYGDVVFIAKGTKSRNDFENQPLFDIVSGNATHGPQ